MGSGERWRDRPGEVKGRRMTAPEEFWLTVYPTPDGVRHGAAWSSRREAEYAEKLARKHGHIPLYRLRVRMKARAG